MEADVGAHVEGDGGVEDAGGDGAGGEGRVAAEEEAVLEEGDGTAGGGVGVVDEEGAQHVPGAPGLSVGAAAGLVEDLAVQVAHAEAVLVKAHGRLLLGSGGGPPKAHVGAVGRGWALVQCLQLVVERPGQVHPVVGPRRPVPVPVARLKRRLSGQGQLRGAVGSRKLHRPLRADRRRVQDAGQRLEVCQRRPRISTGSAFAFSSN